MKVAINTTPLKTAHRDRGIGYYTRNLLKLLKSDNSIEVQEFTKLSELKDVDVVHYPWFDFFFHSLPIVKSFPTVVTMHDAVPLIFRKHYPTGLKAKFNLNLQKLALRSCKHILTDSITSKNDIINFLKIKKEKISVIYLAANKDFKTLSDASLTHIKRKYNLPNQFLLYVGDANWVKNLPFLIEGFNEIVKTPNLKGLKLVLIGGVFLKKVENINHPELESLKTVNRLIDKLKLENEVIRPGNLEKEELVGFYNLATVYIQPSLYEGFGLPILEAFSCGTPVICSNRGSLPEVAGDAAVFFDPTNINQFESIVTEILSSKSLQAKLSKLGLRQAENFSWHKVIEETKKIYAKVSMR